MEAQGLGGTWLSLSQSPGLECVPKCVPQTSTLELPDGPEECCHLAGTLSSGQAQNDMK